MRLRPVVEAEHRRDDIMQLVRQMDRSRPPAIGAARVLESLRVYLERIIELGNRAGEDDCAARRVFLDDSQTVSAGKLPDFRDVGRIRSDRKSTRLNSSHLKLSRMPSSA